MSDLAEIPDHAWLPAGSAPELEAAGFRIARKPFRDRVHVAYLGQDRYSVNLVTGWVNRWGTSEWTKPHLAGTAPIDPQPVETAAAAETIAEDLDPWVRECLAAGCRLDPQRPPGHDPNRLRNRWLIGPDGRSWLAITSSRSLLGPGCVDATLQEICREVATAAPPPPPAARSITPRVPVTTRGCTVQRSLW